MIRFALLLLILAALWGCDNGIETPPSQAGRYTLWGALDPTTDVQSVRVVRVADTLVVRSSERLPVTVTSTDLDTGVETPWRDSLVTFRDGSVGHVYGARFRPAYGSRHRLIVRRDADGGEVTAETQVPPAVVPTLGPALAGGGLRVPVLWPGAPQLSPLHVTYYVRKYRIAGIALAEEPKCPLDTVSFALAPDPGRVGDGWVTTVDYFAAERVVQDALAKAGSSVGPQFFLDLFKVHVGADVLSADWRPPGDVFDFEALAAPEVFGNVRGGYGHVGAGFRSGLAFKPARADLNRVGFFDTSRVCPLGPADGPFPPAPGPLRRR